jgi:hypothetical protein
MSAAEAAPGEDPDRALQELRSSLGGIESTRPGAFGGRFPSHFPSPYRLLISVSTAIDNTINIFYIQNHQTLARGHSCQTHHWSNL